MFFSPQVPFPNYTYLLTWSASWMSCVFHQRGWLTIFNWPLPLRGLLPTDTVQRRHPSELFCPISSAVLLTFAKWNAFTYLSFTIAPSIHHHLSRISVAEAQRTMGTHGKQFRLALFFLTAARGKKPNKTKKPKLAFETVNLSPTTGRHICQQLWWNTAARLHFCWGLKITGMRCSVIPASTSATRPSHFNYALHIKAHLSSSFL